MNHYILNENHEIIEADLLTWANFFEDREKRIVKSDHIDGVHVSTIFLGLDHNFSQVGPPLLFETMIFGGEHDQFQERYSTWEEAEEGHKATIAMLFEVNQENSSTS